MRRRTFLANALGLLAGLSGPGRHAALWAQAPPPPTQEPAMAARYHWTNATKAAAFAPRDGAGLLSFKGKLWLLGGWNPGDKVHFPKVCNSEVWSSADGKDWQLELKEAPWEGRHTAGYAVHRDRLWIGGGDANQGHYQNDVWSSADGIRWEQVHDRVPWGPRVLHYTVAHAGKLWVIGGQTLPQFAKAEERFYSDVWCSADGHEWQQVADRQRWAPRGLIGGAAVMGGQIWLMGGGTYDTPATPKRRFYHDVWRSGDGQRWEQVADKTPWHPRQYHEVAVWDEQLWVLEGYHGTGGNRADVWHSRDGVTWHELPGTPWAARHAASVTTHDGALWVVAGNNMTSDSWCLRRQP